MGERGPLPKPYVRRRKRRPNEQAVTIARPKMPSNLSDEAKAEWRRVVPQLEEMGVIASIDRGLLIRYVTAWADWLELDRLLQQSSKLIKGQKGNLVRNPVWLLRRDADETVTELARQLGLSPMARMRAGVLHERPEPKESRHTFTEEEVERIYAQPDPRIWLRSQQ